MKLHNITLTLLAASLLPAFAYAGGSTDAIRDSFDRDLHRVTASSAAMSGEPDSFTVEFNAALYGTTDPVLASFERDMHREPIDSAIMVAGEADALTIEFYAALRDVLDLSVRQAAVSGSYHPGS